MKPTCVVNIADGAQFDVYIGRAAPRARDARCHEESPFANPFRVGQDGTREEVIELYRRHLLDCLEKDPGTWIPRLRELKGKRLGCWCKPEKCHGDVVARFADLQVET